MSEVSFERYNFVLFDAGLTLKLSKLTFIAFCNKTHQNRYVQQTVTNEHRQLRASRALSILKDILLSAISVKSMVMAPF